MCVPVPPGWEGPIELVDGDACGGADPVLIGASAYDGPWGCECSCSVGAPPTCEGVNVELDVYDVPSCDGDPFTTLVLPDICQNIMLGDAASVFGSTQQEASCETEAVVSAEPVVAIDPQVGCAAPTESCDGGACVGDERSLCIYIPGDTECPAGVFQSRSVLYQGHLDQRSCSACTCTGSFSCDGNVMIRTDPAGCSSPGGLEVPLETCSSEVTTIRALDVTLAEVPTSSCQVRGAENQGGLVPDQPVTVCCAS